MERKEFLGCCAMFAFGEPALAVAAAPEPDPTAQREKEFVTNWLTDLFDTIDAELDEKTKVKLMAGCGKGCFRRHQFKVEIALRGKDDLDNLLEGYKENFEVWREGDQVHVRFGPVVRACELSVEVRKRNLPAALAVGGFGGSDREAHLFAQTAG